MSLKWSQNRGAPRILIVSGILGVPDIESKASVDFGPWGCSRFLCGMAKGMSVVADVAPSQSISGHVRRLIGHTPSNFAGGYDLLHGLISLDFLFDDRHLCKIIDLFFHLLLDLDGLFYLRYWSQAHLIFVNLLFSFIVEE